MAPLVNHITPCVKSRDRGTRRVSDRDNSRCEYDEDQTKTPDAGSLDPLVGLPLLRRGSCIFLDTKTWVENHMHMAGLYDPTQLGIPEEARCQTAMEHKAAQRPSSRMSAAKKPSKSPTARRGTHCVQRLVRPKTDAEWAAYRCQLSCKIGRDAIEGKITIPGRCTATEYALFNLLHAVEDLSMSIGPNK